MHVDAGVDAVLVDAARVLLLLHVLRPFLWLRVAMRDLRSIKV